MRRFCAQENAVRLLLELFQPTASVTQVSVLTVQLGYVVAGLS